MNRKIFHGILCCLASLFSISAISETGNKDKVDCSNLEISQALESSAKIFAGFITSTSKLIEKVEMPSFQKSTVSYDNDTKELELALGQASGVRRSSPDETFSSTSLKLSSNREEVTAISSPDYFDDGNNPNYNLTVLKLKHVRRYSLTFWVKNFFNDGELQSSGDFSSLRHCRSAQCLYIEPRSIGFTASFNF